MGIGTYAYVTTPKIQIDNRSTFNITKNQINNNTLDTQVFNNTKIESYFLENQYEYNKKEKN